METKLLEKIEKIIAEFQKAIEADDMSAVKTQVDNLGKLIPKKIKNTETGCIHTIHYEINLHEYCKRFKRQMAMCDNAPGYFYSGGNVWSGWVGKDQVGLGQKYEVMEGLLSDY